MAQTSLLVNPGTRRSSGDLLATQVKPPPLLPSPRAWKKALSSLFQAECGQEVSALRTQMSPV